MSPFRLAVWTSIGVNYSTYKILERYMLKFSKGASSVAELHKDDLGLLDLCWTPRRKLRGLPGSGRQ